MIAKIKRYVDLIEDAILREKVKEILCDPVIEKDYFKLNIEECPAGAFQHHSYAGGLLQHTVAVASLALTLSDLIQQVYGGTVDRDMVLAGALLHDIMKCYTYVTNGDGGFKSSELGERLDHLSLLVAELYKRNFPIEIIHVVAGHHGEASPVKPRTIEALIISIADMADSELSRRMLRTAEYLVHQTIGGKYRFTSSDEALKIIQAKTKNGWKGVHQLLIEET